MFEKHKIQKYKNVIGYAYEIFSNQDFTLIYPYKMRLYLVNDDDGVRFHYLRTIKFFTKLNVKEFIDDSELSGLKSVNEWIGYNRKKAKKENEDKKLILKKEQRYGKNNNY